jgi:hypothetical protein
MVSESVLIARSISRSVHRRRVRRPSSSGRVLAVFEDVCDLVFSAETVVALVTPGVGNGPLNIVVDGGGCIFASVEPGLPVRLEGDRLRVGELEVILDEAKVWEPRPAWEDLRLHTAAITARLPSLRALCVDQAPVGSLLDLLRGRSPEDPPGDDVLATARRAADALRAGWAGDQALLVEGATQLAGLGNGLTPGGDDFLASAMLGAWLGHSAPGGFCRTLAGSAAPCTTTLSAAFLRAAARGECGEAWHALLAALSQRSDAGLAEAVRGVLTHGATSGADTLAGFLWAGSEVAGTRLL